MHPLIRIVCLLIIAGSTPWLPPLALAAGSATLLGWAAIRPPLARALRRGLQRLRWLLISLVVLYLWFSPGEPLWPALGPFSPTDTGLWLALERAGVLIVMVGAAVALLHDAAPREVAAGLRQLLARILPGDTAVRFAYRVGLLLAELPRVERRVRASLREPGPATERAAALIRAVEREADAGPLAPEPLCEPGSVPTVQWLLPLALLAAVAAAHFFLTGGR